MPPDNQQVLFYPVDETFKASSLSLPIALVALPIISIGIIFFTLFAVGSFIIVGTERILGRQEYTDKILRFLSKFHNNETTTRLHS